MSNKNYDEERPEIYLNRKMRMWNKYRKYCIILAAIIVVGVAGTIIAGGFKKGDKDPSGVASKETEAPTKFYFPDEYISEKQTHSGEQNQTGTENSSENQSSDVTAPTTTPGESGSSYMVQGSAVPAELSAAATSFFADAAFIGDSLVEGIAHYRMIDESRVFYDNNVTTDRMSALADKAVAARVNKIFILVGLNDANYGTRTAENIAANIKSLVDYIKAKDASVNVYVLSILPVTKAFEEKPNVSIRQTLLNETNQLLKTQSENKTMKATYIDIATSYKDASGYLIGDTTNNGFSIKSTYYPFMVNGIAEVLK